jgi:hypothetical protein
MIHEYGTDGGTKIGRQTEVMGVNLTQRHFVHQKSHITNLGLKSGRRGKKRSTNLLSYGTAMYIKKKLRGFGPLPNYADRATAACWRIRANFYG